METEQGGNWMSPLPPGRQQRLCLFSYLGFFTQFEKLQIHSFVETLFGLKWQVFHNTLQYLDSALYAIVLPTREDT